MSIKKFEIIWVAETKGRKYNLVLALFENGRANVYDIERTKIYPEGRHCGGSFNFPLDTAKKIFQKFVDGAREIENRNYYIRPARHLTEQELDFYYQAITR